MSAPPAYKRVLLKLSGECFCRPGESGLSMAELLSVAREIKEVHTPDVQLAIVVGGGNIIRGKQFSALSGTVTEGTSHYMGMLGTVINGMALLEALEHVGVPARLQSAIPMPPVAEPFIRRRCLRHLEKGRVVILAAGTGNPFCTTDTAVAQRARELEADVVLKGTKVDGVYDSDPHKNPQAVRYDEVTFEEVLAKRLEVMDAQAFQHCMEAGIPIVVFNSQTPGNLRRAIAGEPVGTRVGPSKT